MCTSKYSNYAVKILRLIGIVILSTGLISCSNQTNSNEAKTDYHFGNPIQNNNDAQIAAQSALRANFDYNNSLLVLKTQEISYGDYAKQINQPLNQSADLKVWFVLYYNKEWKSKSSNSNSAFGGCVYVAVNSNDGSPVEVGGPLGVGIVNECDS